MNDLPSVLFARQIAFMQGNDCPLPFGEVVKAEIAIIVRLDGLGFFSLPKGFYQTILDPFAGSPLVQSAGQLGHGFLLRISFNQKYR